MKTKVFDIRFYGRDYILVGTLKDGSITTESDFVRGTISYAHLFADGSIHRLRRVIGRRDDIEVVGEREIEVGLAFVVGCPSDPSWSGRKVP